MHECVSNLDVVSQPKILCISNSNTGIDDIKKIHLLYQTVPILFDINRTQNILDKAKCIVTYKVSIMLHC